MRVCLFRHSRASFEGKRRNATCQAISPRWSTVWAQNRYETFKFQLLCTQLGVISGRYAAFVLSAGLVAGMLSIPAVQAEPAAQPMAQPAAATIAGTPTELLATLPVTEPLTVGYTGGLFISPADLKKKDKRGCSYRNQVLLKLATKKPRIGKKCTLSGGEWRADFGRTVIKKASQVKLGKLLPDKFVYAQGAYGWTPEQRKAYANSTTTVAKATRSSMNGLLDENSLQLFSSAGFPFIAAMNLSLSNSREPQVLERELATLKKADPALFESWTVASILNAKSWGLSFSIGIYASTSKTLRECTKNQGGAVTQSTIRAAFTGRSLKSADPCNTTYSLANKALQMKIIPIPMASSQTPPISSSVLNGYGTPSAPPIDRHLFGIHAPADWVSDVASGFDGPINPATIPDVPVGYLRLWDTETTWRDIEPANGQYDWRKLGKQIEMAQILDARVMLVLGGTPAWAGDGSVQSNPRSIDDWRDYVGTVACRYGPSITAYEVWNEANLQTFWKGTPAEMAELTKVAFEEIRRCNPSALVVAANTTSRATGSFGTFFPEYLEEMKKRGWPADAYSVHSYPSASGGADDRIKGISQFRSMLALAGAPFTTTFDTEINYGLAGLGEGKVDLTGETAMTLLSRTYIDSARYGFGSTFWFVWTANPDSKFGIQLTKGTASERVAWRTTYDWLVGAQYQRCLETPEKVVVCQFNKGADNFSLVWRGDVNGGTSSTSPGYFSGLGSRVCDLAGNCQGFTTQTQLPISPMPRRIDGPALTAGPSAATPSAPQGEAPAALIAPAILSVTLEYGAAGDAEATGAWASNTGLTAAPPTGHEYAWFSCVKAKCSRVGGGSSPAGTFAAKGNFDGEPGTYEFRVRAISPNGSSEWSTKQFEVLDYKVAPPNSVLWWISGGKVQVRWTPPAVPASKVKGYEVRFRNLTSKSSWKTIGTDVSGGSLTLPATDVPITVGQTGQVDVRVNMKSGARSVYVASQEWTVIDQLPEPWYVSGRVDTENKYGLISAWTKSSLGLTYPNVAYQIRYAVNGGPWVLATLIAGQRQQGVDPTWAPFNRSSVIQFSYSRGDEVVAETRTVSTDGRLPSEWRRL